MTHLILFVCTANICRSPMAHALFNARARRENENQIFIAESMGTWATEKIPASSHAIAVMAQRGLDLSRHRARIVTVERIESASVVLVMTRNHKEALFAEFPKQRRKIHMLSELQGRLFDINDPYGGTLAEYAECARQLETMINAGYDKIKAWALEFNLSLKS